MVVASFSSDLLGSDPMNHSRITLVSISLLLLVPRHLLAFLSSFSLQPARTADLQRLATLRSDGVGVRSVKQVELEQSIPSSRFGKELRDLHAMLVTAEHRSCQQS